MDPYDEMIVLPDSSGIHISHIIRPTSLWVLVSLWDHESSEKDNSDVSYFYMQSNKTVSVFLTVDFHI